MRFYFDRKSAYCQGYFHESLQKALVGLGKPKPAQRIRYCNENFCEVANQMHIFPLTWIYIRRIRDALLLVFQT